MAAFIGALFLLFFLAAFLPWLLSKGMTAAVEGLMDRIGFGHFSADTIWDWLLVLVIFAAFTAFLVAIATAILALYNVMSQRTGMGLQIRDKEIEGPKSRRAIAEPVDDDEFDDLSFDELYLEAQQRGVKGRSNMSKGELRAALRRRKRPGRHAQARPSAVAPPLTSPTMRLREHPRLVAVSALLAALESVAILALGPRSAVALAPQVAALPPFGVFHDLRWLLVYHQSWLTFVLEVLLLLGARTGLETVLVRAAWPSDVPLPAWRDHAVATAKFTAISAALLLPFAVLLFAMAVTSLSWLFFVAVPVLVMVAVLVHHGAVDPHWWRDPPVRSSVVAVVGAFGLLTLAGAIFDPLPDWLIPVVAAAAGVGLAWCRLRVVGALAGRSPAPRRRPFVLVGLAGVVALVVGGTAIGFGVAVAVEDARTPLPEVSATASGPPVLIVKGFNSDWDGVTRQWVKGNYRIRRFSYRGLDEKGAPRTYERGDTHASVQVLARKMRRQVDALHDATGQRVNIVAESEGALIAQAFLAGTPHAPVRTMVLLSPLLEPGRVDYPELGHAGLGDRVGHRDGRHRGCAQCRQPGRCLSRHAAVPLDRGRGTGVALAAAVPGTRRA